MYIVALICIKMKISISMQILILCGLLYIYIYINFEAINDVLDAKMVLKVVRLNLSTQVKTPLL